MKPEEKDRTIRRYEDRLQEYGVTSKTMGWRDKEQQHMRFAALAEVGSMNNRSVLDVGCGFGDLYDFLKARDISVKYTGYDLSQKLVVIARDLHPDAAFDVVDISEEAVDTTFDYVVSSGIFNARMSDNEAFLETMIRRCFDLCNVGVAVNMTSRYVDYEDAALYYYSPERVFGFCRTLTKRVTLRHDYMPYEFTVYLYRNNQIDTRNVFVEPFGERFGRERSNPRQG